MEYRNKGTFVNHNSSFMLVPYLMKQFNSGPRFENRFLCFKLAKFILLGYLAENLSKWGV